ncbi:hypothetical protein H0H87_011500 [Tephrocybe sp. NHM501043]|nr:hypothetical protein H0H87_011500 [Tephrocybe sp. NHM501043]
MRFSLALPFFLGPLAASALTSINLHRPLSLVIGQPTTITWDHEATDPNFTLFLMGTTYAFDLRAVIAYDLDVSLGTITTTFPVDRVTPG